MIPEAVSDFVSNKKVRVSTSGAKVCIACEKSAVEVRRKSAKKLSFRRISVFFGLICGQNSGNGTGCHGIIEVAALRTVVYEDI